MNIKLDGNQIEYREEGRGTPLILIHAFPLNQTMWDDQVSALRDRCRVITLDLPGFGLSSPPPGPFSMEQMAGSVRAVMSTLNIDRAIIAGLSMGGYIALAFYRNYPNAVQGLILADTRAGADTPEGRQRRFESAAQAESEGTSPIAGYMTSVGLAQSTALNKPEIARRLREMIQGNSAQVIAAVQRAMADRADSTPMLPSINCPVLVIVGDEDALTPIAVAEEMENYIPGARFKIIKGAGHFSNLEQPDEFNQAVIEFMAGFGG